MSWRVVNLGGIPPIDTQSIYHAAALLVSKNQISNTLYVNWPLQPLVCVGYHQEVAAEVDLDYCRKKGITVVRRRVGGGAVYLDHNQVFYQVIMHAKTPGIPKEIGAFYKKLLEAPVRTYRAFGVEAKYAPVNDIVNAEEKKISGNGAGQIEDAFVLVGNIIVDFDFNKMASILKVPSEKFRGKVAKSLRERIGTLTMSISQVPSHQTIAEELIRQFSETLKTEFVVESTLTEEEQKLVEEINTLYKNEKWLFASSRRRQRLVQQRAVRISGDRQICEGVLKSVGGLVRVTVEILDNEIQDILISGDFSIHPGDAIVKIEDALKGVRTDSEVLETILERKFDEFNINAPGLSFQDIAKAICDTTRVS